MKEDLLHTVCSLRQLCWFDTSSIHVLIFVKKINETRKLMIMIIMYKLIREHTN